MADIDACPPECPHATFHYCSEGTHCDVHCCCPCRLCVDVRTRCARAKHALTEALWARAKQIRDKPAAIEGETIIAALVNEVESLRLRLVAAFEDD